MGRVFSTSFSVYGKPVPKGRPRFTNGRTIYTPPETVAYEKEVRKAFYLLADHPPEWDTSGPVSVDIQILTRTRRKIDVDNVAKSVMDALNKTWLWKDDSQITKLTVKRGVTVGKFDEVIFRAFQYPDGEPEDRSPHVDGFEWSRGAEKKHQSKELQDLLDRANKAVAEGDSILGLSLLHEYISKGGVIGKVE